MRRIIVLLITVSFFSCAKNVEEIKLNVTNEKAKINKVLDGWHSDAANADFEPYFNKMTSTGVFIGTDAEENWNITAFKNYSKPHFDKGRAWSFKAVERNIYVDENGAIAWFDELLNTHMGICRGSGVLRKMNKSWKIEHYVLSLTIPNNNIDEVIKINKTKDSLLLNKLKKLN